jgi:hypothetical protein
MPPIAEVIAITYQAMGLLPGGQRPNWTRRSGRSGRVHSRRPAPLVIPASIAVWVSLAAGFRLLEVR